MEEAFANGGETLNRQDRKRGRKLKNLQMGSPEL
jgi:hypothetical protein